jgi:ketosteroid isomerase-like protein
MVGVFTKQAFAALAVLACLALGACHRTPDEQQVREAIATAAAAARGNDADGVLAVVSDDFVGNDGELDRHGLKQMLALRAFRKDSTGVLVGPVSIERQGDRLIASFTLTLTGGKPDSLLPDQADVYEMRSAWRKDSGEWHCYSASWSSATR